jgi:hypothetical protein
LKREQIGEQEEAFLEKERHDFPCKGGHGNRGTYQKLMAGITSPYGMDSCTKIEVDSAWKSRPLYNIN